MRKRFEQQIPLGVISIPEVQLPENSRDELPPVLKALQYVYTQPEINGSVFNLLENSVFSGNNHTGRPGMSLWEILVLGVVRLCLDIDYDRLHIMANYDKLVRSILGIENTFTEGKTYSLQSLKDNIHKIDDPTLEQINQIVCTAGFNLKKKDQENDLSLKIDTYALETNVHFPTDLNLLWDATRKCISIVDNLLDKYEFKGWRKIALWLRQVKNQFRDASKKCFVNGYSDQAKKESVLNYINLASSVLKKVEQTLSDLSGRFAETSDMKGFAMLCELEYYKKYIIKQIDLIERRVINDEKIPSTEKVHSIFEPYTEWLKKGKAGNKVELGLKLLVATDQYNYIRHYEVVEKQVDSDLSIPVTETILRKYPQNPIGSLSFDKGFASKENKEIISLFVGKLIMPLKGKLSKVVKQEESSKEFKMLRNAHSAVEANINQLENNGLNRCPDKGIDGLKRYVGFGVLSYNLHHLGKDLIQKETDKKLKMAKKEKHQKLTA